MYKFTKDCLIGVSELDSEHKELFALLAAADAALKEGEEPVSEAMVLINKLKHYAASHFAHEEAYMERIHDPELPSQKREHSAFVEKINSYSLTDVNNASAKVILSELLEYLSKWLMRHILGSDLMIGQFKATAKPTVPVFDDSFKTGIALIDEEHQVLFDIIKRVHLTIDAELVHDKYDAIMSILDELKEYTRVHFSDEENYMRSINYSGLAQQELLHQSFIDKLNELDLNDLDNNQEAYLFDFLSFLQNWLINHILKVDRLIPKKQ